MIKDNDKGEDHPIWGIANEPELGKKRNLSGKTQNSPEGTNKIS